MPGDTKNTLEEIIQQLGGALDILSDTTDDLFFIWDVATDEAYVSAAATRMYNLPGNHLTGVHNQMQRIVHEADRENAARHFEEVKAGRTPELDLDFRALNRRGNRVWVNLRGRTVLAPGGDVHRVVGSITEIGSGARADKMTGLLNHRQLAADFAGFLDAGQPGYLLVLGIDDFKPVNDRLGRAFGDMLLQMLARILEERIGAAGRAYRLDGDRFGIVLPDKNRGAVNHFYLLVKDEFREACRGLKEGVFSTLSGGAVAWPDDSDDFIRLSQFADSALNAAKRNGKDKLFFFSLAEHERYLKRISLRQDLQRCVSNNFEGFSLHFQPQVTLATGAVQGAEALLRWNSPNHGPIPPLEFIPLLEKHGLICQVGRWVLEQALAQCKRWRAKVPNFQVSINLSYIQLEKDDIAGYLLYCLRKLDLPGSAVLLEITESEQLSNYSSYNETLAYLNKIGAMVAIDDFGTGYSSLGYFKELRVDQIKIDRCFVARVPESEYDYRLVKFIIELAHSVDVAVCVEGIETPEELEALLPLKPDSLQGYYFGRPVAAPQFEADFIDNWQGLEERHKKKLAALKRAERGHITAFVGSEETLSVFENLAEIVHISEPVTGELYYLNRAGRQLLGVENFSGLFLEDILLEGKGNIVPIASALREAEYRHWTFEIKKLGLRFCSHDRLIPWDDHTARLGICVQLPPGERDCGL